MILIRDSHSKLNMTRSEIDAFINTLDVGVIVPDNLDEGFVGVAVEEDPPRAVYSIERCIKKLAEEMPHEEATEYFWFNVAGAGGEGCPIFVATPEDESPY